VPLLISAKPIGSDGSVLARSRTNCSSDATSISPSDGSAGRLSASLGMCRR